MFDDVNDLSDLSRRRQELIKSGLPAKAVNSAFNTRKRELSESTFDFHEVPFRTVRIRKKSKVGVYRILGHSENPNVLNITSEGIYL